MSRPAEQLSMELIENFRFLGDWSERYAYLIELGEALGPLDDTYRTEENRVQGCMSHVWVKALRTGNGYVEFVGDCDTAIVKGILAVLIQMMSGLTPERR